MGLFSKIFKSISGDSPKPFNKDNLINNLEDVLNQFSDYEIRTEISASEFNAPAGAKDYSYGLYYNGYPKALIMILDDRNHYRKKEVILAREAAEHLGIPYMNFMPHLPNKKNYIYERINKNLMR